MFMNFLHKTATATVAATQMIFARQAHAFDRGILKTKMRCHFPKPREVKRIKVHGWDTRMSTPEGRRVLMRRILKGKHVLSH